MENFSEAPLPRGWNERARAISTLAAGQGGVVARHQLHALGLDGRAIARRVDASALHPAELARGIYKLTPAPLRAPGRRWAALLWAPPSSALGFESAGALFDLNREPNEVHVVCADGRRRPAPGVVFHETRALPEHDVRVVEGVRSTTFARTALDLAGRRKVADLDDFIDAAARLRLYDGITLDRVRSDRPTAPGIATLNLALGHVDENTGRHRSRFELLTTRLIATTDLIPMPTVNVLLEGLEPDLSWWGTRGLIELDGRDWHRSPAQIVKDGIKEERLRAAGYVTLRLRWEQIVYYPEQGLKRIIDFYLANTDPPVPGSWGPSGR